MPEEVNEEKKMKKKLWIIIVLVLLIAGCSKSDPSREIDSGYANKEYEYSGINGPTDEETAKKPINEELKLIKNGSATIKTKNVNDSYQNVLDLAKEFGGYQTDISRNEGNYYTTITVEFKIPADNLDAYLDKLNESEDVKYLNITTKDITNEYYDSDIRLKQLEKELAKYQEFFDKAANVEEMLRIQYEINRTTTEIEILKGQFKLWDSLIDYSTVNLDISEYDDVVHEEEIEFKALSFKDFLYFIKSGFVRTMSGLVSVVQYAIIFVISGIPVWLPVGGIVYYVVKRRKKKNGNK
jgi:PBP1b-binding outer membrane lipoprotein LpoB